MSNKRIKLDDEHIQNKFHKDLFNKDSITKIESAFKESKPYLHCKIDKLIDNDLLVRVRKEILSSLHFTVKETDIYKVNQNAYEIIIIIIHTHTSKYRSTRLVI